MLEIREPYEKRTIKDVDGKEYIILKSPSGWSEEYLFYDSDDNLIESFEPNNGLDYDDVYFDEENEVVEFYGMEVNTKFPYSEFFL